jgi:hypothetical protein
MRALIRQLREECAMSETMTDLVGQLRETARIDDINHVADEFIRHCTPNSRKQKAAEHLEKLVTAYLGGEIYNVEWKDAKDFLSWCVDGHWQEVRKGFNTKWGTPDGELSSHLGYMGNLHETIAARKKFDRLKPTTKLGHRKEHQVKDVSPEFMEAARTFLYAAEPVAQIVKALKSKTIKGRKPLSPEKQAKKAAQLAKKDVKTCACCFRAIARLKHGKKLIADHGYTLRSYWGSGRVGSCPGGDFPPLEVSDAGLRYMIDMYQQQVKGLKTALRKAPDLKKIPVKKGWGSAAKVVDITPDDPSFASHHKSYVVQLESNLRSAEKALVQYKGHLKNWKKQHD